ncbi:helix-turn-helix transcriptional regulator [Actinoplanes sp. NPDC000266]
MDTAARLLRLLSLLQSRRDWTGPSLAERLGVTTRTIRHDIGRLRSLGYPVDARPGVAGGYRLGTGSALPPLLLDDDEAVAVAVNLRGAALTKLEQLLPPHLRHRVRAVQSAALLLPSPGPPVDPDVLTHIAYACQEHERLRFDYRDHAGLVSRRDAEPYRLVHDQRRWYLLAWDPGRDDWRTFRADRMTLHTPNGPRFTPRPVPPSPDVARGLREATWRYRARVIVHAPAAHVRSRLPVATEIEPLAEDRCAFTPGSDNPEMLALWLGFLGADFEVVDAPELLAAVRALAARYAAVTVAADTPRSATTPP